MDDILDLCFMFNRRCIDDLLRSFILCASDQLSA